MGLRLMAEVGLDGSGFESGMKRLGASAGASLKGLVAGAFGVYSIHQAITKTVESAGELVDTSQRLDTTVEQLQVLREAAKQAGSEFSKLPSAFERINKAREKALSGDKKTLAAFARFGVGEDALRNQSAADIFTGPMAAAVKSQSAQDLAAPGSTLLGKGFGELIPVLKTDFEELQAKMEALGMVMSTEAAVKVDILADEFGMLSNIIVAQLAPALGMLAPMILKAWGALQEAGAYWVGLATNNDATASDWIQTYGAMLKSWVTGKIDMEPNAAIDRVGGAVKNAEEDQAKVAEEQRKIQEAFAKQIQDMIDRLKNPTSPEVASGITPEKKKAKRGGMPDSDSLVAVGNFLGGGSQLIASVAEQQLSVARQQLDALNTTNDKLSDVVDAIGEMGDGDIEVP